MSRNLNAHQGESFESYHSFSFPELYPDMILRNNPRFNYWAWRLAVLSVLVFGWALALFRLDTTPPGFQHDETFNVLDAIEVVYNNFRPQLYFPKNFGREPIFYYTAAAIYRYLIGIHWVWGLRFAGVLWAMPGVALTLTLAKRYLKAPYVVLTGMLLVTSFWFIFTARVGLRAISLFPISTAAFYFLLLGFETRSWRAWIAMGVMAGLAVYTYVPGRFLPPIVAAIILFELVFTKFFHKIASPPLKQVAVAILVMALVAAPMAWYIFRYPEFANQRISELDTALDSAMHGNIKPLLGNGLATLQSLLYRNRDALPYHYSLPNRAVLSPILAGFFALGIIVGIWRFRQRKMRLLLIWLIVGLLPNMVTQGGPFSLRAIMALPVVFIFIALGAAMLVQWGASMQPKRRRTWGRALAVGIVLVGLGGHAIRDISGYFYSWTRSDETQIIYRSDLRQIASYLNSIPAATPIFISSSFWLDLDQQTYLLYNPSQRDVGWFNAQLGMPWPAKKKIVIIYSASSQPTREQQCALERMQLHKQEMTASGEKPLFSSYQMPPIAENELPCELQSVTVPIVFDGVLRLDAAVIHPEGGGAVVMTLWTVLSPWPHSTPPKLSVRLKDAAGSGLVQIDELLTVAYQHWQVGDRFLQVTRIPQISPPPQEANLFLVIYDEQGALPATIANEQVGVEAPVK